MMPTLLLLAAMSLQGCAPHGEIVRQLDESGYSAAAAGVAAEGALLLEIFVDETGNWIAVLTRAGDRLACVKAAGSGWTMRAPGVSA